jgi:nitrilase
VRRASRTTCRSPKGTSSSAAGGSAILAPDGSYLAGPLWDEEGILYAELDPEVLLAERQRFDAAGHYHRPDVLRLTVRRRSRGLR